jgi:phage recombination protein Bet
MAKEREETGVAVVETPKVSLLAKFGRKYSVAPEKVYETLRKTAFSEATSEEQVIALLVVADQYGLNPFTKEIYAFPDKKGGVVPIVGVDGWNRIANQRPEHDGVEFNYADEMAFADEDAKDCPEWVEVVVYRKDREHPTIVREYLDECYRPLGKYPDGNKHKPGHWQTHTKRALRHKALIQGYRIAFGFHGIYDPDEASNFINIDSRTVEAGIGELGPPTPGHETRKGTKSIESALAPAEEPEVETEPEVEETAAGEAPEPSEEKTEDADPKLGL